MRAPSSAKPMIYGGSAPSLLVDVALCLVGINDFGFGFAFPCRFRLWVRPGFAFALALAFAFGCLLRGFGRRRSLFLDLDCGEKNFGCRFRILLVVGLLLIGGVWLLALRG